jgi:ADP-ribosylglycohydrolase
MMLELAVGDAYGAGFEYAEPSPGRPNDLSGYVAHPRHHGMRPGCYTDDTQMSIAIAELLLADAPWTPANLADRFVDAFKRDPREGYASSFHAFLVDVSDGADFLARIRADSDKSGAAMRAAPIGLLPAIPDVLDRTRIQAMVTHNTPDGIAAAQAAALLAHYCAYRLGPKAHAGRFIASHVPGKWAEPWKGKVGPKGWMSVRAAITALGRCRGMSDLLIDCVAFGGDVDTVATIALAAASCSDHVERDLPAHLIDSLENGPFGRDYLINLDARLSKRFPVA